MEQGPRHPFYVPHNMASQRASDYPQQPLVVSTSISSTKRIIEGIEHALTHSQRYYAVQTALQAFHHNNKEMHNYEVGLGAANALCLKLGYAMLQNTTRSSHNEEDYEPYTEISMICCALRMVYGCSLEARVRSFNEMGQSELLPLLIQILGRVGTNREYEDSTKQHARHVAIQRTLQILRVFAKLHVAKEFMIEYGDGSLLKALVQVLWSFPLERTAVVSEQAMVVDSQQQNLQIVSQTNEAVAHIRIETLGTIKDLSFPIKDLPCTNFIDRQVDFFADNVVPAILRFCPSPEEEGAANTGEEEMEGFRLRESISAVLWNLALSHEISVKMARRPEVIGTLIRLTTDENAKTRRHVMSVLGNLANADKNHKVLLAYREGALVQALMKATQEDVDNDTRRRAMRTIRCLSSGDSPGNCSTLLFQQRDFVEYLIHVVANDVDPDTRIQACETMGNVASKRNLRSHIGKGLIYIIETVTERKLLLAAFRALMLCMLFNSTEEEAPKYQYEPDFFKHLEIVVRRSYDSEAQSSLARLLLLLERDDEARKHMICDAVMDSLATLLSEVGPDYESSRTYALEVVTRLVAAESHKRPMAEHESLLIALVNYAFSAPEGEKKEEAKSTIEKLVQEI